MSPFNKFGARGEVQGGKIFGTNFIVTNNSQQARGKYVSK